MTPDTDSEDTDADTGILTGQCDRCEWHATAESHAELVTVYQDHLREAHPMVWLRT